MSAPKQLSYTLLAVLFTALLCASCGGRSFGGTSSVDAGLDGPFCEGAAKVGVGEARYGLVVVTSTAIVMDCCEGASLRFHSSAHLGFDLGVEIQAYAPWALDAYDLEATPGGLTVWIHEAGEPAQTEQALEGWLRVNYMGEPYRSPFLLSLCVTVTTPNDPLDGYQLFVQDVPVMPWDWYDRFSIWLLEDPLLDTPDVVDIPLDALALDDSPLVPLANVDFYSQSTHTLYWGAWYTGQLQDYLPQVPVYGLPFVVMADDQRIYLGAFVSGDSSVAFDHPVIVLDDMTATSATIAPGYPAATPPTPDPRADPRILQVLGEAGKLAP
jgi:hypothetical protein